MRPRLKIVKPPEASSDNMLKLFSALFYLYMAYMMTIHYHLSGDGLGLLMVLGLLYAFFVRRAAGSVFRSRGPVLIVLIIAGFFAALSLLSGQFNSLLFMASVLGVALAYWLMVGRTGEAPYFLRFHLLTALLLNFMLLLGYQLLQAVIQLLLTILQAMHLGVISSPLALMGGAYLALAVLVLFWGAALYLSFSALLGRTPYIAMITGNVRHWA